MKINRTTPRKLERLIAKVKVTTPKQQLYEDMIRTIHNPVYSGRYNLERYAEEMKPQEYLEMRRYYSSIEMEEMLKGGL